MFQMLRHKNVHKKTLQMIEFAVRILCIHFENDGYMSVCMNGFCIMIKDLQSIYIKFPAMTFQQHKFNFGQFSTKLIIFNNI